MYAGSASALTTIRKSHRLFQVNFVFFHSINEQFVPLRLKQFVAIQLTKNIAKVTMKRFLGNLALQAGRYYASQSIHPDLNGAMIIPPAIPGSLGDAAMLSASIQHLQTQSVSHVDLMFGKPWKLDAEVKSRVSAERFFYENSLTQKAGLISKLSGYSEVYFVGADVIDGAYNPLSVRGRISILEEAAKLGKKATLLGSSYNKTPEETTASMLRKLPAEVTLCARDPISRKRMEQHLNRSIRQTADLAFLLKERPDDKNAVLALEWIRNRRIAGDQVIALNANYLHAEKIKGTIAALPVLMEGLLKAGLSILLVPHDNRSKMPDSKLLSNATEKLPMKYREKLYMFPAESPGAIKAVLAKVDMLVSGRMHAAILAMSGGTPAYCFSYQDKFEGLYSFFDLQNADLLSSPEIMAERPEIVVENILARLKEHNQLRIQINEHLPAVMSLSRSNFQ